MRGCPVEEEGVDGALDEVVAGGEVAAEGGFAGAWGA